MSAFAAVLETPELVQLIVGHLQLADVALVALQVNRTFREEAHERVATPKLSRLLAAPFNLSRRDLLRLDHLDLANEDEPGPGPIGDAECTALSEACTIGALPALRELNLFYNQVGDAGLANFAKALGKGALPALAKLDLTLNNVGVAGITALGDACAKGALPALVDLRLGMNYIGDEGMIAFTDALGKGALLKLEFLSLTDNQIGDQGLIAFCEVIDKGALLKLEKLYIGSPPAQLKAHCSSKSIKLNYCSVSTGPV